ncbi:TPA: hypothetical protein PGG57_005354 [Raoultella planticola]|nr:hypothetical protein [Raoultella planticola]HDG9795192.1 hypothetical protein [Raoultella planticola]HDH7775652.1 hypothetical protein [Raoultella planticola]
MVKIDADSHIADVHSLSAVGEAIRRRPVIPLAKRISPPRFLPSPALQRTSLISFTSP